jgi:hypothetical protein
MRILSKQEISMSTTEQEMDDALDALEQEHGNPDEQKLDLDEQKVDLDEQKPDQEIEQKAPGYISYDDWIAKGKDPADYKGENAYKAEYERITEIRELKDTMNQVVSGVESWQAQQSEQMAQQVEQAKVDAQAALDQAVTDEDLDAALAAKDKLVNLNQQTVAQPMKVNPVITDFAKKNPIIDTNSPQYSAEFHQDMIMIHNGKLDQLLGGDRTRANELSPAQIERVQAMAYSQAKELHADKFTSPRNRRTAPTKPNKRPAQNNGDVGAKLKGVKGNLRNPRDTNAANDIYEIIKARDPKAAEVFAKNLTGE